MTAKTDQEMDRVCPTHLFTVKKERCRVRKSVKWLNAESKRDKYKRKEAEKERETEIIERKSV
jgi:hypothetical protein